MIKKLQHRFIFISMAGISLIFALLLLVLNIFVDYSARHQGYMQLYQYEQRMLSDKHPPQDTPPDLHWFNNMRISYVFYDVSGEIIDLSAGGNPDMTENTLRSMAENVLQNPKETGSLSGYLYLFRQTDTHTRIYFLDYSPEKDMSMRLFETCLWVGLAGIFVLFVLVVFLSKWVTRPVQLAFDKQRQFIADASHELKTPLTIITANAEVLESSISGNKWLSHILEQSARMKVLINNLLELARMDAYSSKQDFMPFDMSRSVKNAALSFESIAYEYGKNFSMEIENNITLFGSDTSIRQLTTILLDNAFKYSDEKGTVLLRLSSHGEKKVLLVHNTGNGIPASEQKHIFERFYRSDTSRSRQSGGYGLGLSIAQSIAEAHNGHITVKSDGLSYAEFMVTLP